jgi:hypothetical protein
MYGRNVNRAAHLKGDNVVTTTGADVVNLAEVFGVSLDALGLQPLPIPLGPADLRLNRLRLSRDRA